MVQDDAGNAELKTFAGLSFPSGCYCVGTEGEVCSVPVRALPGKTHHGVTTNVAAELIVPRRITLSFPRSAWERALPELSRLVAIAVLQAYFPVVVCWNAGWNCTRGTPENV